MFLLCFLFLKEWPMLNARTQYHNTIMNLKVLLLNRTRLQSGRISEITSYTVRTRPNTTVQEVQNPKISPVV